MENLIKFEGSRNDIIKQLSKYMNHEDAKKFFNTHFKQNRIINNTNLGQSSFNKVNDKMTMHKIANMTTRVCYKIANPRKSCITKNRYCKITKRRTLNEINETSITIGSRNTSRQYVKTFSKLSFIAAVVALDIVLYCTLNFSFVGTTITAITSVINPPKTHTKEVIDCIISIVKEERFLPKYSVLINSKCKNMNSKCVYKDVGKCKITKDTFVNVVNELIEQKILKISD